MIQSRGDMGVSGQNQNTWDVAALSFRERYTSNAGMAMPMIVDLSYYHLTHIVPTAKSVGRHKDVLLEAHALLVDVLDLPQACRWGSGHDGTIGGIVPKFAEGAFLDVFDVNY